MKISELKLLRGDYIGLDICKVYQPTMNDIVDLGEGKYNQYLNVISIEKDAVLGDNQNAELEDLTSFELSTVLCHSNEDFKNVFLESLSYFIKESVHFYDIILFIGEMQEQRFINDDIYEQIIRAIKLQNCILKEEGTLGDNPANDKAKELLEKRRKAREKINKLKNSGEDSGESLTMGDLISILCSNGNGVSYQNVWDMPIYMFNNQFSRMKMLEDYDINIRSLLAGASSDDVELKHWMSKIE